MTREHWAVYSVKDHMIERAFVADVMLYDRIVVPRPADNAERQRWIRNDWDPDRLDQILEILTPDRTRTIDWNEERRKAWRGRWDAVKHLGGNVFQSTREVLLEGLPKYVTGVQPALAYSDIDSFVKETGFHKSGILATGEAAQDRASIAAAVMGRSFLVPAIEEYPQEMVALEKAVEMSSDREFKKRRAAYWRWQTEYLEDIKILDVLDVEEFGPVMDHAIEEMNELIADEKRALNNWKFKFDSLFAFTGAATGVGLLAASNVTPVGLAVAFLGFGTFLAGASFNLGEARPSAAAFFTSSRRAFGWDRICYG